MRSLFLRIFLSLSAALILILLAIFIATMGTGSLRLRVPILARSFMGDEIAASAASTLALYRSAGPDAVSKYFDSLREANGTEAWLIHSGKDDIFGHAIPDSVRQVIKQATTMRMPVVEFHGFRWTAAVKLESNGELVTVAFSRRLNREPRARVITPEIGYRYLAGLLAAIVFSYILSKLIARPIEELRQCMRRYSGGTATLALPSKLVTRKDELGDLAREFDQMSHRIEGLLQRQQQLIADISHELRSPLTRLTVAVEIARDSKDPEPELLERITREASNLEALIQQLLRLAALENQDVSQNHAVSLTDLLAIVIENAEFEAEAAQKTVVYESSASELCVAGDESLLASAFENVLRNAIRYTPAQSSVTVSVLSYPDDTVLIQIRDHGPGVPVHVLPDLFKPFFRVGTARDRDDGGVGLGLAIAQRSIAVCGGSIAASNHKEGGLVVDIRLKRWTK